MKERNIFLLVSLVVIMALIGLVSSCSQSSTDNQIPIGGSMTVWCPLLTYDPNITQSKLSVYGLVERNLTLTYESILAYPSVNQTAALYCYGEFLSENEWTGVPVSTLLTEAGIKPEAESVVFHAEDGYFAELSLTDAMRDNVLLAYKANGQQLSEIDGYPLRLVVNGVNGDRWVRWVIGVEVK